MRLFNRNKKEEHSKFLKKEEEIMAAIFINHWKTNSFRTFSTFSFSDNKEAYTRKICIPNVFIKDSLNFIDLI